MFLLIFKVLEWSLWWSARLGWPVVVFVWSLRVRRGIKLNLLKVRVVRWPRVAHDSLAPLGVRMRRVPFSSSLLKWSRQKRSLDLDQKDHFPWYDPDLWRSDHHLFNMIQTYEDQITNCSIWSREKIIDHHLFDMIQGKKYRSPLVVIWSWEKNIDQKINSQSWSKKKNLDQK